MLSQLLSRVLRRCANDAALIGKCGQATVGVGGTNEYLSMLRRLLFWEGCMAGAQRHALLLHGTDGFFCPGQEAGAMPCLDVQGRKLQRDPAKSRPGVCSRRVV